MPHTLELPRMLCAVIPLMRGERRGVFVVGELVALAFREAFGRGGRWLALGSSRLIPGLAAIVGALDDLSKPAARLRRVDAVGIFGRTFEVIHLPTSEVWAGDVPVLTLAVRG